MKVAVLFSGGKDSSLAAWIAKKEGHELACLVSIASKNKDSYMFHIPSIDKVRIQAEVMGVPLIFRESEGVKEEELVDLEAYILEAVEKYGVEGVVTGAVGSVYQASRVKMICDKLGLESINPLWQMDQIELLRELIAEKFKVIIVGVAAYPLDASYLGREINEDYINDVIELWEKFEINPAGEGGEFESFVLNCPLFERELKVVGFEDSGEDNAWRRELDLE
ncbi:MAG: diphthine--ammonia ligase [archaeon]